jgi:inosine/xanthosine triphosphatase
MKIAIGSLNPVKVAAVELVVRQVWPDAEISSIKANSGVSDMPNGDDEMIQGAFNRAKNALEMSDADLAFGNEGGVVENPKGMFLTGWTVAMHRDGRVGMGGGGRTIMPEKIANEIRKGRELGPVMDEVLNDKDTKKKEGAVGTFTNGLISRKEAFALEARNALSVFVSKLYD